MKVLVIFSVLFVSVYTAPKLRVFPPQQRSPLQHLTLPGNATSIRSEITDSFSCDGREYGYYADVENDCQIFHVCLPITYHDGHNQTFRWSFICPEETIFNQEMFTCTRADEAMDCIDSPNFYNLNTFFGNVEEPVSVTEIDDNVVIPAHVPQVLSKRKRIE